MGLFGKKSSKKVKKPVLQDEEITFDTPYGKFYYINNPMSDEFGYEADIPWSNNPEPLGVYIDTDDRLSTNAGICLARLEAILADSISIDYRTKEAVAEFFMTKPEMVNENCGVQDIINNTELFWLGVLRNGDTQFGFDAHSVYADNMMLTVKADKTAEIRYRDYDHQLHTEPLSTDRLCI